MPRAPPLPIAVVLAGLVACRADLTGRDAGADAGRACADSCCDGGVPPVPGWDDRLGPWLRQLRVQPSGSNTPGPVAWSMINQACQNRSVLLQLALLLAKDPTKAPLLLKEADLTDAFINDALAAPALEVGSLNVTGPLMVEQCLLDPGGKPLPMSPWPWYWPYHHVPAVKINGQWMVFDLSVGDRPIAIDVWLKRIVAPPAVCQQVDQATYTDVWAYWNIVLGSAWDPPAQRPVPLCGYNVTSPLTFREGAAPGFNLVRESVTTMEPQTGGFRTLMGDARLSSLSDEDLARVTTVYEPMTEKTFCARPYIEAKYCATLK